MSAMEAEKPSSFVKIKGLISQMVEKLMAEANAEASQKAFCDKEKAKSSTAKEQKTAKLDKYIARTDKATNTVATLEEPVKSLEAELVDTDAAMSEASKLRAAESEEYEKASPDYKASAYAAAAAIQVLKSYYEGGLLHPGEQPDREQERREGQGRRLRHLGARDGGVRLHEAPRGGGLSRAVGVRGARGALPGEQAHEDLEAGRGTRSRPSHEPVRA